MSAAVRAFLGLTGARLPIVQAPMANFAGVELAIAALSAGGVGSLPCAVLDPDTIVEQARAVRDAAVGPINLNFFAHRLGSQPDDAAWRERLAPFYAAEGVGPPDTPPPLRRPFDEDACAAVETARPEIVSFHFGLPDAALLARVRATGAKVFGNATNVAEARWLAQHGCDAIIAQGFEAGGHAGHFLRGHRPIGLFALIPQVADATGLPVIAAGGIADERGAAAAIALGAGAVQAGTAYLVAPESRASAVHRAALAGANADDSLFTNLFTGGLARGLRNRLIETFGAIDADAPPFPYASAALAALKARAETAGRGDYSSLWAGQGVALARAEPAATITEWLGMAALNAGTPA
jgi:nitronate monooxygenase